MRLKRNFLLLGILLSLCVVQPLAALAQTDTQPVSGEDILFQDIPSVYGASKFEQKVSEAPSSVTIITQNEIKKYGYRNLGDILRSVRGFFVTNDRNYSYLGVRGFGSPGDYNTRVLMLVDGHRLNDSIFDQAPIGNEFPVDVDLIDRVEIIRGPSSSIYGTNAFFGVINIITRRGRDLKGAELSGGVERYDAYKGRTSYGERFSNGLEVLVSGSYSNSRGPDLFFKEYNTPSKNNGWARGCDWEDFYNTFSKWTMQDFTLETVYGSRNKGVPTAPWQGWFNDSGTGTTDERGYLDLKYEHSFSNDFILSSRLYYDHYHYDGTYAYNGAGPGDPPDIYHLKDFGKADWWGGNLQFTKKLLDDHKLLAGVEFRDNFRQNQGESMDFLNFATLDSKKSSFDWAAYVEDQYQIFSSLILNAGVRYDHFETFGGTVNPRVALIYNPFRKSTFKFIYGEAFRAPNAYELYYEDGYVTKAANHLDPEKIHTYEAVWEQLIGDRHKMTTSVYYYNIDDLIRLQLDPADGMLVYENLNKVNAKGAEWEFETRWAYGIETKVSYAYQKAKDGLTDMILTNSPRHTAKVNFLLPVLRDKAFLGTEFQYMSPRKTLSGRETDNIFLTNLTLFTQNFVKGLEVSASVYNLFNQKYGDPGSDEHIQSGLDQIGQDGINFRVKVTYSF